MWNMDSRVWTRIDSRELMPHWVYWLSKVPVIPCYHVPGLVSPPPPHTGVMSVLCHHGAGDQGDQGGMSVHLWWVQHWPVCDNTGDWAQAGPGPGSWLRTLQWPRHWLRLRRCPAPVAWTSDSGITDSRPTTTDGSRGVWKPTKSSNLLILF